MERKREAPAVVAPIAITFRRLCRSARPLCIGAPLCLAPLIAPPAEPPSNPPLLSAAAEAAKPEILEPAKGADPAVLTEVNGAFGIPSSPYGQLIYDVAVRHSINPHLVAAMIHVESAFNPRAVSRKGACGLMQLLPATARRFGLRKKKDLFDPQQNVQAGVRYLKWLTLRFGGDVEKILAAYNAGEGAVERFGGIPPYRETQQYVEKVFSLLGFQREEPVARGGGAGVVVVAGGR